MSAHAIHFPGPLGTPLCGTPATFAQTSDDAKKVTCNRCARKFLATLGVKVPR